MSSGRPDAEETPQESGQDQPDILVPRRRPIQERSRRKFEALLTAARSVLVEVGFDSFTCEEVASRAGVPIGTLYQFFANKYVLICELDRVDTAENVAELMKFSGQVPAPQWPDILDDFIDHLAGLWRDDPSRRAVWHAVQSTPSTRATAAATEKQMLDIISSVVAPLSPDSTPEERLQLAGLLIHTVSSLLNYAIRDLERDDDTFESIVTEIKRMLVAYLFAVATA